VIVVVSVISSLPANRCIESMDLQDESNIEFKVPLIVIVFDCRFSTMCPFGLKRST
jgi:hypothetical protein